MFQTPACSYLAANLLYTYRAPAKDRAIELSSRRKDNSMFQTPACGYLAANLLYTYPTPTKDRARELSSRRKDNSMNRP